MQKAIIVKSKTHSGTILIEELEEYLKKGYKVVSITSQTASGDNSTLCYYGDFLVILEIPKKVKKTKDE